MLGIATEHNEMFKRLASAASGENTSVNNRLNTLRLGLEAYRERPILGWGHENFRSAWGRYVTEEQYSGRTVDQAHNKALDTLVSTGTVGFFVFYGPVVGTRADSHPAGACPPGCRSPFRSGDGGGARRLLRYQSLHVRHAVVHASFRNPRWLLRIPGAWRRGAGLSMAGMDSSPDVKARGVGLSPLHRAGGIDTGWHSSPRKPRAVQRQAIYGRTAIATRVARGPRYSPAPWESYETFLPTFSHPAHGDDHKRHERDAGSACG